METQKVITLSPTTGEPIATSVTGEPIATPTRHTRTQMALAFGVAGVSDVLSIWATFAPPLQWAIDLGTAFALFMILGKRWALLPGLIAEAIPGMGIFPWWVLVVGSILVYDGIKKPRMA